MFSLIVGEDEKVASMIKKFAEMPSIRGIFVVDKNNSFKGIITRKTMLNWARVQMGLGLSRTGFSQSARLGRVLEEIVKYAYATVASDFIDRHSHEIFVREHDSIIRALNLMITSDLIDIPVIDDEGKIIGDLKLNEILNVIIDKM